MTIKERYEKLNKKKENIQNQLDEIVNEIKELQLECKHEEMQNSGYCSDCGFKPKGWFCKYSPTYECDYYDKEHDEYDEDCCIYCGQPEERK